MPHETVAVSAQVLCTPYNHAPCHIMQSPLRKVYMCLAVTCHLHVWQDDWDLLRATAVTRGWNGYQKKSQHRWGFELVTFQSQVRRSNQWAIPAPISKCNNFTVSLLWNSECWYLKICHEVCIRFYLLRQCGVLDRGLEKSLIRCNTNSCTASLNSGSRVSIFFFFNSV